MPLNKSIISFMKRDMRISLKPVGLSLTVRLKYIPDSCGDDELTVKNYKKSGNTETFDCYDNSYFTHSVVMKKNDKGQTVVQISYEKGKTNGRKIVCGTEAEYDKYWEEYRAKNGGDGGSTSTSDNPVDKATKKVKSGLKSGLNKLKKKK